MFEYRYSNRNGYFERNSVLISSKPIPTCKSIYKWAFIIWRDKSSARSIHKKKIPYNVTQALRAMFSEKRQWEPGYLSSQVRMLKKRHTDHAWKVCSAQDRRARSGSWLGRWRESEVAFTALRAFEVTWSGRFVKATSLSRATSRSRSTRYFAGDVPSFLNGSKDVIWTLDWSTLK